MKKLLCTASTVTLLLAGSMTLPAQVVGTGTYHSFFICTNGITNGWGHNVYGQLGTGTTGGYESTLLQVAPVPGMISLTGGLAFSMALDSAGRVWAWGTNFSGALGWGNFNDSYTAVQVVGLSGITAISAGTEHGLALKNDGTVWAWGRNAEGQLGINSTLTQYSPVQVTGLTGIVAISAGYHFSMALKNDGTVWAWGENLEGQLGDNSTTQRNAPVQVSGLTSISGISAGYSHAMALKSDSTVWTWGSGDYGQLGHNALTDSHVPVLLSGISGVRLVDAGDYQSYALVNDSLWAWGSNNVGQLGNGNSSGLQVPASSGIGDVDSLSSGDGHILMLKRDGSVWGSGYNLYAQLAQGDLVNRYSPVLIAGTCENTNGVAEQNPFTGISAAPNPFSVTTTFSFTTEQSGTRVSITDVLGNEVQQQVFSGTVLVIEKGTMTAGVYFVQFTNAQNETYTEKIIVQ
jgi:alpha-tubulin suppressor-like RCC1 family protein